MPSRQFLVNVEPPEIRVAEVRDGRLFDLDIERDARMLGNIYKGRVENILPGMDAAFLNIGQKRNALLYVGDIVHGAIHEKSAGAREVSIGALLKTGQELMVQVARPAVGTKGARVTMRLSLPGRYAILVAGGDTAGVSKRIESEEERTRLRRIADRLRPLDHGLIIRTEAEGANETQLSDDVALLVRQLDAIRAAGKTAPAPTLVHEDVGLLGRIARDRLSGDVDAIWIDSVSAFDQFVAQIRAYAPQLLPRLQFYAEAQPIFAKFNIEADARIAGEHFVPLQSGGSLVIDEAEALCAIDVNTGKFVGKKTLGDTVLATNLEAVAEIARQLRLRDLGGIIVVDFIDMDKTRDRVKVLNTLETALKDDRNRTRIVQISPSGLVEMTRRREGQSLLKMVNETCPTCAGVGFVARGETIAIAARRRAREMALENRGIAVLVTFHPEIVADFLGEDGEWAREFETSTGAQLRVRVDSNSARAHVHFERIVPGVALAGDLALGALIPIVSRGPFYPHSAPQYAVAGGNLISIEGLAALESAPKERLLIEITAVGRHFCLGRLSGNL
ncbi:RNAse G [Abditibacterium utsteinense]|uniref:RNAse G n=1 Tax=Abditibacterium utsteinense TaxID=1960156 RepID=A0A2S8SX60_9BACT|nr:Rne/Rng family ribonuclease [Abditibacterium utsteinense]PQV65339.1 RNAse G [Abditibacterium utsteinense]